MKQINIQLGDTHCNHNNRDTLEANMYSIVVIQSNTPSGREVIDTCNISAFDTDYAMVKALVKALTKSEFKGLDLSVYENIFYCLSKISKYSYRSYYYNETTTLYQVQDNLKRYYLYITYLYPAWV